MRYYCIHCGYNTPRHYFFKRHFKRKTRCVEVLENRSNPTVCVNEFGKETISHISDVFLTRCVNNYCKGFRDLFTKIHFDNPANNNIRATTVESHVEVFQNDQWIACRQEDVFTGLILRYRSILLNFYLNNENMQQLDHHREKYEYISTIEHNEEDCGIIKELLTHVMKNSCVK